MDQLEDILKAGGDYLAGKNVDQPQLACELLAARLLGCKRLELPLKHSVVLNEKQLAAMRRGIKRVGEGEPVQYVIGEAGFMGHTFKVDTRALIPRPETETLVERVLDCAELWEREKPALVDVGTGSGCIAISLALARPNAHYVALDASGSAIDLAKENAQSLGATQQVAFANEELSDSIEPETLDAIVANLPYIPTEKVELLPPVILHHEPRQALDGGVDGLTVVRAIAQDATIVLKPNSFLFLEIGEEQGPAVTRLLKEEGFRDVVVVQDLNGRDRVVKAVSPGEMT